MSAIKTSPFWGHSVPPVAHSPRIGYTPIFFPRIVDIYLDGTIIMGNNMDNVYFCPLPGLVLDSTRSCRKTAECGDIADRFIEERSSLYQITKNHNLTGQRKRENVF